MRPLSIQIQADTFTKKSTKEKDNRKQNIIESYGLIFEQNEKSEIAHNYEWDKAVENEAFIHDDEG